MFDPVKCTRITKSVARIMQGRVKYKLNFRCFTDFVRFVALT